MDFAKFMSVINGVTAPPNDHFRSTLQNIIQAGDSGVKTSFFNSVPESAYVTASKTVYGTAFSEFSVKYISFVLSTISSWSFNATVSSASSGQMVQWLDTNGKTIGANLVVDYLNKPDKLAPFFADTKTAADIILAGAASETFFTGFVLQCQTAGSSLPVYVFLQVFGSMTNGDARFRRLTAEWSKSNRWSEFERFGEYKWFDGIKPSFAQNGTIFNVINEPLVQACNVASDTYFTKIKHYPSQGGSGGSRGSSYEEHWKRTVYGVSVSNWLNSANGPSKYNIKTSSGPNNTVETCTDAGGSGESGGGCMIRGTQILYADGTYGAIEAIAERDRLYAIDGSVAECSAELLCSNEITELYAINDDEPFMTFEHAVYTDNGWRSLAPRMSMALNPDLEIGFLRTGDVIWKIDSVEDGQVTYRKEVVTKIETRKFKMGEAPPGFVFHIRNGHRSYHANGYCCLAGYPQITTGFVTSNMLSNMNHQEQEAFTTLIRTNESLFKKALGTNVMDAFLRVLKQPAAIASRSAHTNNLGKINHQFMSTKEKIVPQLVISTSDAQELPPAFEKMTLINGHLFINGEPTDSHIDGKFIHWHRTHADGQDEIGSIKLMHNGLVGKGTVQFEGKQISFNATGLIDYTTTYKDEAESKNWFHFDMGFVEDGKGGFHTVGKLIAPGDEKKTTALNKASKIAFSIVQDKTANVLHATIEIDPNYCALRQSQFVAAEFDFSLDYRGFNGFLYDYDSSETNNRGTAYELSGACNNFAALQTMLENIWQQQNHTNETPLLKQNAQVLSQQLSEAKALSASIGLSINELFTLPTPDLQTVHEESFAKLKNLMLYSVDDQWLKWFGQSRPKVDGITLTQADVDVLKDPDVKPFLVNRFAVGYLTQAFAQSKDPNIEAKFKQLANVDTKMNYFWKGTDNSSFPKEKGYNIATSRLMSNTYAQSVPGLQPYLAKDAAGWAKKLYEFCTAEPTLTGLAIQNTLDGRARITHLSSLLYALDPSTKVDVGGDTKVSYSTALYEKIVSTRLNFVTTRATASTNKDFVSFLTEYFRQYFNALLAGDKWADNIRAEALKDLKELMDQFEVDNVNALVSAMGTVITDAVTAMRKFSDLPIAARINQWANDNPKVRAIGTALTMAVYGFAIVESIQSFLKWEALTPEQKTLSITTVLDTSFSMFSDLASYRAAQLISKADAEISEVVEAIRILDGAQSEVKYMSFANRVASYDPAVAGMESPALSRGGIAAGEAVAEAEDIAAASVRWTKISKVASGFARGMTIIALGAACVVSGFEVAKDFASGQPVSIKVLDILSVVANGVAFLAEAGAGIAALAGIEVCSAIPVVGVVAAVVGIGVAIALIFIHRTPPPTPEEDFVENHCKSFINALKMPTTEWLAEQKKLTEHLNNKPKLKAVPVVDAAVAGNV
ncbi:hypothetical protein [Taibaiella soli]|uniref:Uncharacterized protein n=1 Tax=Taibaiella soli TaxID=1649169 RepID=A0A2W2AY82_9BACT|nr:hypothetical protein [Taibaiella soli]PZF72648.1 hypothetical protein DN068_12340 [Taibaiella soli]